MDQCVHIKDDGNRCEVKRALEETSSGLKCIWHDPARKEEAAAIRTKGRDKANIRNRQVLEDENCPPAPESAADVVTWSSRMAREIALGTLDPKRAQQITNSLKLFLESIKVADLERKIAELTKELERLQAS
jgi:hypothetical protein